MHAISLTVQKKSEWPVSGVAHWLLGPAKTDPLDVYVRLSYSGLMHRQRNEAGPGFRLFPSLHRNSAFRQDQSKKLQSRGSGILLSLARRSDLRVARALFFLFQQQHLHSYINQIKCTHEFLSPFLLRPRSTHGAQRI